jgi:hypothetical protein
MKSFALAALVATVSAEAGYNCVNPTEGAWTSVAVTGATDHATCGTEGTKAIEADADFKEMDFCLHSKDQAKVEAVADDTTTADVNETVAEVAAAYVTCEYFKVAKADPAGDIRTAAATENGLSYEAWAWGAGEPLPDKVAAAEGDADSAKMITSALAAIATIAMVAY